MTRADKGSAHFRVIVRELQSGTVEGSRVTAKSK
jgi:hypothetical protein